MRCYARLKRSLLLCTQFGGNMFLPKATEEDTSHANHPLESLDR